MLAGQQEAHLACNSYPQPGVTHVCVNLFAAFTYFSCFLVLKKVVWQHIVQPLFKTNT